MSARRPRKSAPDFDTGGAWAGDTTPRDDANSAARTCTGTSACTYSDAQKASEYVTSSEANGQASSRRQRAARQKSSGGHFGRPPEGRSNCHPGATGAVFEWPPEGHLNISDIEEQGVERTSEGRSTLDCRCRYSMMNTPRFTTPKFIKGVDARPEIHALKKRVTEMLAKFDAEHLARRLAAKGIKTQFATAALAEKALGPLAAVTVEEYEFRTESLLKTARVHDCDVWAVAEDCSDTRASWNTAAASLKFSLPRRVRAAKNELDRLERLASSPAPPADLNRLVKQALFDLCYYANMVDLTPSKSPEWYPSKPSRKHSASKKNSLSGLPADWQAMIGRSLATNRKHAPGSLSASDSSMLWLVQCLTGCRPEELVLGVRVEVARDGATLKTEVQGAKQGLNAGQAKRRLTLESLEGPAEELARLVGFGSYLFVQLSREHKDAYTKRVSRAGEKVTPERDKKRCATCYTARSAFAADLGAAGVSRKDKAKAMGHQSEKSARFYAGSMDGGGAVKPPLEILATSPVKARPRFKSNIPSVMSEDLTYAAKKRRVTPKP